MFRTAMRNLFAACSSRDPRRSSTLLRPALMALEERQLLANYIVSNPTDTPVAGEINLRQAIVLANTVRGFSTITFSSLFNTPQTITLGSGALDVKHDVLTIDGPAAGLTINGGGKSRDLVVESSARVEISNLTITGGYEGSDYGGGVYNRGTLTLNNCTVTNNHSETTFKNSYGGGVYNVDGTLTMKNSTVSNNQVGPGSGAFPHNGFGGGIANYNGTVDLVNCTVNNNKAGGNLGGNSGGGLYNFGRAFLTNSTFVGNTATYGGGLQNHGDAEVVSCTFVQNQAYWGGGMFLWNSLDLWNTIIGNNTASFKGPDIDGHVHSGGNNNPRGGYNLISNTKGSSGWASSSAKGTDLTDVGPGVTVLGSFGGPTKTAALVPTSAAVHKGTKVNYAGTNTPLVTDQRGRPLNTPPDIGAFQLQNGSINA
jgi:hypothetical protein